MADGGGSRRAAQVLARALVLNGIDHLFCVAGESFLALLDAAYDERHALRLVILPQASAMFPAPASWRQVTRRGACRSS